MVTSAKARAEIAAYREYEATLSDDEALLRMCGALLADPDTSLQRMLYLRARMGLRPLHLE